jgi:glycosyltransferase involved in cell wall biosynthesis
MDQIKIAIVHPQLVAGGGSEAPLLWTAEALKENYIIYLITMGEVNLNRLNDCYGTNIYENEVKIISIPIPVLFKNRFDALRSYRLARFCKNKSSDFDLMISTYNVMDFGRKGIQYISDFSFADRSRRTFEPAPKGVKRIFYQESPFRWMYLKLGEILARTSKDGWKRNLTIANSDWSGKIMKENYGIETKTIYPPVANKFPDIPWNEREDGFVVLARLSPEKRIEKIVEILESMRKKGQNIHLHILGRLDDIVYTKRLKDFCDNKRNWISFEGLVVGNEKLEFIAKHKFSISGRENEPFGIAVAEAVKAGCITWVPNGGGQTEIVNHPNLIYQSVDDAANKIDKILKSDVMQEQLREHLSKQAEKFSTEKFTKEIRNIVIQFFE